MTDRAKFTEMLDICHEEGIRMILVDPRGMLETGRRYLTAQGTERDVKQAIIFLEQAAANGMNQAFIWLEEAKKMPQMPELPQARPTPSFQFKLAPQSGKN